MSLHKWINRRQYGMRPNFGDANLVMKRIYSSLEPCNSWNDLYPANLSDNEYGGVFNMEFSPHGSVLAAACEKKTVVLFDPVTHKQTQKIVKAHSDNVNCVKFIDNQIFATCSDDSTVAIWDIRFLKQKLRTLHGHSSWVKNIEYSYKDKLVVTSGFDGSIFTWDINSHTEEGLVYQKVFNTAGLMRCRISPDSTKMIMCTTGGYIMIIHNLDLATLNKDLSGFRPNVYRLMQMGNQFIPQAAKFDYLFSKKQKKNRVELVTDFPDKNDAEIILALQIHPHGLSFLSRNISFDEQTEWSCLHDINEEPYDITVHSKRKRKLSESNDQNDLSSTSNRKLNGDSQFAQDNPYTDQPSTSAGIRASARLPNDIVAKKRQKNIRNDSPLAPTVCRRSSRRQLPRENTSSVVSPVRNDIENTADVTSPSRTYPPNRPNFVPDIWAAEISVQERAARQANPNPSNTVAGYDFVYAISSGIMPLASSNHTLSSATTSNTFTTIANDENMIPYHEKYILQNARKLMYYVQESNEGKGFIKEPCFSSDGRIIFSPHTTGVRLLSYSEDCSEHPSSQDSESMKKNPKQLFEVKNINCHSDIVLSTSFSPKQPLLVTGCKLGKITWHYPYL